MPPRLRLLLVVGIGLTAVSLVGMAVLVGVFPNSRVSPNWLIPSYVLGAICLLTSAIWWTIRLTRSRDKN